MTRTTPPQTAAAPASRRFLPWLVVLFLGGGCAALIYEIVWMQLLELVIGLTSVSMGLLLGTFMGGMCLGSLLLPRLVSPRRHPLRVYALLELGIGVVGIATLFCLPWVSQIYTQSVGRGLPGILLRGAVAAACLLPATILMGATLPAAARWIESTRDGVSWLGFFYGANTIGAVFGCLLAGFYLLRVHEMATATYVAASINAAVALAAFALAARGKHRPTAADTAAPRPASPRGSRLVYLVIGLSGMSALGAEVVWTRLLSLILGGTVYSFSIILAVFLAGLGIGGGAGSLLARSLLRPRLALACCQALLTAATAWTAFMIADSLPYWPIDPSLTRNPWLSFQLDLARCIWVILPAAILWGASFPLALASAACRGQDSGRLVGRVYAANTVGAILGALGFSLALVPWFGTKEAERVVIALPALAALLLFVPELWNYRTASKTGPAAGKPVFHWAGAAGMLAGLGLAVLLVFKVSAAPWSIVAYGRYAATYADRLSPPVIPEKDVPSGAASPDIFCTYVGEGLNGSVAVTKWRSGVRNFHSAGKVQASNDPRDMRLQRLLGHISALATPNPETVLVVACGAGVTAGTFVLHPATKRIVICDIEPLVPKMVAPMFKKENYGVVSDPRTEVVLDDGRHFIRTTREKFDVISSDPIDPWVKGCAALNTVEYYQMCKDHLKPGGVMSLWIPLYESNPVTTKSVIATFFKVFPNGILWSNDTGGEGYDAVLFGQAEPSRFDIDELQARLDRPDHARVKQSLAEVEFGSAIGMLATYAGRASDLKEWMSDAQINTDANMRLQYLAGMSLNSFMGSQILSGITRHYKFPEDLFVGSEAAKTALKGRQHWNGAGLRQPAKAASVSPQMAGALPAKPPM
jgi:spermidine synthase